MLNKYLIYLVILLAGTSSLFAYTSYNFYNKKAKAEFKLEEALKANTSIQNSLILKESSCKINDDSVVLVEAEKKELQGKIDSLEDEIDKLSKKGPLTKKPTTITTNTEAPKNAEKDDVLVDSQLLSDELIRLLKTSYCNVEPNDSYCSP